MQLSRCCNPVPGDRILGYITRGRGLTIHSVDCPNLGALDYDRERLVEVEWDTATPSQHAVKIAVIAEDKTGVLANVSSAIAECNANISRAEIITREDRKAELDFVVEIADTSHLNRVLKAIERVEGVITARRLRSWRREIIIRGVAETGFKAGRTAVSFLSRSCTHQPSRPQFRGHTSRHHCSGDTEDRNHRSSCKSGHCVRYGSPVSCRQPNEIERDLGVFHPE